MHISSTEITNDRPSFAAAASTATATAYDVDDSCLLVGQREFPIFDIFNRELASSIQSGLRMDDSLLSASQSHVLQAWSDTVVTDPLGEQLVPCEAVFLSMGFIKSTVTEPLFHMSKWLDDHAAIGCDESPLSLAERFLTYEWNACYFPVSCPLIGATSEKHLGICEEARADGSNLIGWNASSSDIFLPKGKGGDGPNQFVASVDELCPPLKPGNLRLYHGTSREAASGLLQSGVDNSKLAHSHDFGRGMYFTPCHRTALDFACD